MNAAVIVIATLGDGHQRFFTGEPGPDWLSPFESDATALTDAEADATVAAFNRNAERHGWTFSKQPADPATALLALAVTSYHDVLGYHHTYRIKPWI